jgi:hypothetical protein
VNGFLRLLTTRYGDPDAAVPPIAKSFGNRHNRVFKSAPDGRAMPPRLSPFLRHVNIECLTSACPQSSLIFHYSLSTLCPREHCPHSLEP